MNQGDQVFIIPTKEHGVVAKIRKDGRGEPLIDVRKEDGELHVCRDFELKSCKRRILKIQWCEDCEIEVSHSIEEDDTKHSNSMIFRKGDISEIEIRGEFYLKFDGTRDSSLVNINLPNGVIGFCVSKECEISSTFYLFVIFRKMINTPSSVDHSVHAKLDMDWMKETYKFPDHFQVEIYIDFSEGKGKSLLQSMIGRDNTQPKHLNTIPKQKFF